MCWGLHIMEGDAVRVRIETTAQAVAFFGAEHVKMDGGGDPRDVPGGSDLEWCLCPIDVDHLLDAHGYRRIPIDDPRWDACDTRIERIA